MEDSKNNFHIKPLVKADNAEDYNLYHAALEWDLIEPIVIESKDDMRSESKWRDRLEPYHHQVQNLITFCRRLPVTLLADDVGLGKTISAGLIVSELMSRGRVSKILVVCPKLLIPQWREEFDVKFGIPAIEATGRELINAQPPEDGGAVITTYQSARLYFDYLSKAGYDMLILDEAHKLRNLYGVDNPPQVAVRFRQALAERTFRFVLMLTATPIQNRLWDLYSLIDLLTVARGHQNPFGNQGIFARKYIADNRTQARQLRPEMQDEFRSIVYGYMSRVRRGDADLDFPERVVELRSVDPTPEEIELIKIISEPIQELNILTQIGILQSVVSSPEALMIRLNNMARNKTVPQSLADDVRAVVNKMPETAKLKGLGELINQLRSEQPEHWRAVVFTKWRETQTTIQAYLEGQEISCGLINGDSGQRNQETIAAFKKDKPDINVIISTEAGSEGVNLQAANVLVNYDLPWNPMIVEQRIGRIQRLASKHANVCIFNIVLKGTFEEYIVGRLMEKLQMASQAIGDVESLLEASGIREEDGSASFEQHIRKLVVASLAGKDVELAARKTEESIIKAKAELEREEKNINTLLGSMDDIANDPTCPKLPDQPHSMDAKDFVLVALNRLGSSLSPQPAGNYISELEGRRELIYFDESIVMPPTGGVLYSPGTLAFERLVNKFITSGKHRVTDGDLNMITCVKNLSKQWVDGFEGSLKETSIQEVEMGFEGTALIRVRATVAHDSYERLLECYCSSDEHYVATGTDIEFIDNLIDVPEKVGVKVDKLLIEAKADAGIKEFCRFYLERMKQEVNSAGDEERKRKKLEDDFTPRLEVSLVGLEGVVQRRLKIKINYSLDTNNDYASLITIVPSHNQILNAPEITQCDQTSRIVPVDCVEKCAISGKNVLRHLLVKSGVSGRVALIKHTLICTLSGKRVLTDEVEKSDVTHRPVTTSLLKTSALSGKRAEPQFITKCEFSETEVLDSELATSQVSGKRYRIDEELHSAVSGKIGHKQEFVSCAETNQPLLQSESEECEITGKIVMPGTLEQCELTGKKVLPSELEHSVVSGRKALKRFFVSSSLSEARLIEDEAAHSSKGKYCLPLEAKPCNWSGRSCHPDDLQICELTGLDIYFEYIKSGSQKTLKPLIDMMDGVNHKVDLSDIWSTMMSNLPKNLSGRGCKIESAVLSPDKKKLALCMEIKTLLGLKKRQAGFLYLISDNIIIGRVILGKREPKGWIED